MKNIDPWIHGSAAGAAASAAAVCIYYVSLGGALRAPLDVRDKVHTAAAEAAAPAADPWIHGSIFFIVNNILNYEMKSRHPPQLAIVGLPNPRGFRGLHMSFAPHSDL